MATVTKTSIINKAGGLVTIRIEGTGFGASQGANVAEVNNTSLTVTSWSDTAIEGTVADTVVAGDVAVTSVDGQQGAVDLSNTYAAKVHNHDSAYDAAGAASSAVSSHTSSVTHLTIGTGGTDAAAGDHTHEGLGGGSSAAELTAVAGENLTAHDIVKIINDGGPKAYKFLTGVPSGNPPDISIYGTVSIFESAACYNISATALSDTKFVVCYTDVGNSNYGTARVGTVDGSNNLTWGTVSVFESAYSTYISATALSDTKFVVCYTDVGNSYYGTARVGIVDGSNNLTWGIASEFESANSSYISATALSDTKFVVCYKDAGNSNYGTARVGIVDGSNHLTWGTVSIFKSTTSYDIYSSATALSDTKFVVCYAGNSSYGTARVGIVDGSNNLTWGTASVFEEAESAFISATALSDTKFVVCYQDRGNSEYGTARVGTVDGSNNLTWGTVSVFESATTYDISATALSDTKTSFVVCYRDIGNSHYGTARVGIVDGSNNLTWGTVSIFKSATSSCNSATALSDTKFVVCYQDTDNSGYGTARVGITNETTYTGILLPAFSDSAVTAASSGTFKLLQANAVIANETLSLTALTPYYLDSNSKLSATPNANFYVGIGLSSTELFVDGSYLSQTDDGTTPVALHRK